MSTLVVFLILNIVGIGFVHALLNDGDLSKEASASLWYSTLGLISIFLTWVF